MFLPVLGARSVFLASPVLLSLSLVPRRMMFVPAILPIPLKKTKFKYFCALKEYEADKTCDISILFFFFFLSFLSFFLNALLC